MLQKCTRKPFVQYVSRATIITPPPGTLASRVRLLVFSPRVTFKADWGIHLRPQPLSSIMLCLKRNISATAFRRSVPDRDRCLTCVNCVTPGRSGDGYKGAANVFLDWTEPSGVALPCRDDHVRESRDRFCNTTLELPTLGCRSKAKRFASLFLPHWECICASAKMSEV